MQRIPFVVAALLGLASLCDVNHNARAQNTQPAAQNPQAGAQKPLPPLGKEDLYRLLKLNVSSVDILVECARRKIDTAVDLGMLTELENKGADRLLLNKLSEYYLGNIGPQRDLAIFLGEERYQRVIELADATIERSPRLLPAWLARARARLAMKEAEAAESDLLKILEYAPEYSFAQLLLAQTLDLRGRSDEAIAVLSELLNRQSASAYSFRGSCYFLRAKLCVKKGNHRQAADDFHRAIVYLPRSQSIWNEASQLFARSNDPAVRVPLAAKEFAAVLRLLAVDETQKAQAQLRLAEAEASGGRWKEAKTQLELATAFTLSQELKVQSTQLREQIDAANFATWPASSAEMQVDVDAATSIQNQLSKIDSPPESKEPPLFLLTRPVNQKEWAEIMGTAAPQALQSPQEEISWNDAQEFINKLNALASTQGFRYRLPTFSELKSASKSNSETLPANFSSNSSPQPMAIWCDDPYKPIGASETGQTPFRVIYSEDVTTSNLKNDQANFAPAASRFRNLGMRLAAIPVAGNENGSDREKSPTGRWGLARSIELASRMSEWSPLLKTSPELQTLLQIEVFVRLRLENLQGALDSARRLIQESNLSNPRRAEFARCLLVMIAANHAATTGDQELQKELGEAIDLVRGRTDFSYWFAEYARAILFRSQQNWVEARASAERALSQSPNVMHGRCRELLEFIKANNSMAEIDPPSLLESLSEPGIEIYYPPPRAP